MLFPFGKRKKGEMSMKHAMSIFVAVCCAVALVTTIAFANECPMCGGKATGKYGMMESKEGGHGMFSHKAGLALSKASELGLSDEQVSKIKTITYNIKKGCIKNDADIKSLALDIKTELGKDDVNVGAVNPLIDKKFALKAQGMKDDIQANADLNKILTPDQQKKLKDMCMMGKGKHSKMEKGEEDND